MTRLTLLDAAARSKPMAKKWMPKKDAKGEDSEKSPEGKSKPGAEERRKRLYDRKKD